MSTAPNIKGLAIAMALKEGQDPFIGLGIAGHLLACLTSATKSEREWAKAEVRKLALTGQAITARQALERNAERHANRGELD